MVEHSNDGVGEGTLESEKWWNMLMSVVAIKVVDNSMVIYSTFVLKRKGGKCNIVTDKTN